VNSWGWPTVPPYEVPPQRAPLRKASAGGQRKAKLFLYDVAGSYLEGGDHAFGADDSNRYGKKGKNQIVIRPLWNEQGKAISSGVFRGNRQDTRRFAAQVKKASQGRGCDLA
jgi:hypothetical protein